MQENVKATRHTHQKDAVWQVFSAMRCHPTADAVFDEVARLYPGIGRATVYRILNSYIECGRAIKVPVYDGADRFDITTAPHSHAKCKMCGAVEDITTDGTLPQIIDNGGFIIEGGFVLYHGLCRKCSENQ